MSESASSAMKCGCGCFGATLALVLVLCVIVFIGCCIDGCIKRHREDREYQKAIESDIKAEETYTLKVKQKTDKLRAFALKEAPSLWQTRQKLAGEVEVQNKRIEELRETLVEFGRRPDDDQDFIAICKMRDEMNASIESMRVKLEDAYIAAKKFEATPSKVEYDELRRKAIDDGVRVAEAAAQRFARMKEVK